MREEEMHGDLEQHQITQEQHDLMLEDLHKEYLDNIVPNIKKCFKNISEIGLYLYNEEAMKLVVKEKYRLELIKNTIENILRSINV